MTTTTQRGKKTTLTRRGEGRKAYEQPRAAPIGTVITALIAFSTTLPVASSCFTHEVAPVAEPLGSVPLPQTRDTRRHADSAWRVTGVTEPWAGRDEPTAALRAAVWAATVVTAIASVAVAAAPDQVLRYRRPARTGSIRWEAGWAGQASRHWAPGYGQAMAAGGGGKVAAG